MNLDWRDWYPLDRIGLAESKDYSSVYRVSDGKEIVYIGQTKHTKSRMRQHIAKFDLRGLSVSIYYLDGIIPHRMLEMENDLIGSFIETQETIPRLQFSNML